MPRVTCAFCGLPFSVRRVPEGVPLFCCSGCALASRIPVHGDALPVSRQLIAALALGFGLFNEVLFGVLGSALVDEGRIVVATRFLVISGMVGAALFAANLVLMLTARTRTWTDAIAVSVPLALAGWAVARAIGAGVTSAAFPLLLANLAFAAWWSRGWARRYLARLQARR